MARGRTDVYRGEEDPDGMEKVTHITDHVFTSPKPYKTIVIVLVASLLLGIMFYGIGDLTTTLQGAFGVFLVPGLLAAIMAVPIANGLGGRLYLRRSMLMVVICMGVMMVMWVLWAIIDLFSEVDFRPMAILLITFPFYIWHTVLSATSDRRAARTVWSSSLHAIFGLVGLHWMSPLSPGDALFAVGILLVILMSVSVFTNIARAPIKRNYAWDGLDLVKHLLAHWTEGVTEGVLHMEGFFDSFGVEARVPVSVLAFRPVGKKGLKAVMVVPGVHPGPFGHLAGSDLPSKIPSLVLAKGKTDGTGKGVRTDDAFVMVPHGASTHDVNPTTTPEAAKVALEARRLLRSVEYSPGGGRFSRSTDDDRVSVTSQTFGDSLLMVHDPAGRPRDDLDQYIGKEITKHANRDGFQTALFVDAHNCISRGSEIIFHHSPAAEKVVDLAERAVEKAKISKREALRVGFARDTELTVEDDGIGPAGIQALVTEVGDQRTAYVLIDGNNIYNGFAKGVMEGLKGMVNESVVMTTDNHIANVTMGGFNPVGMRISKGDLTDRTRDVVKAALKGMEECEAGAASGTTSLRVFGPGATARMTATINSTMSVMKIGAAASLALTFTGAVLWYHILAFTGLW